ncbi:hypothetical protein LTS07_009948 [Exophiala sideris]|uniref:Uncharacterized protein n=1 Tax=Exophiala sideris TaxID=1016849 RepID=A0ABR0IYL7_9EURO|nr:hypothetical protein LTS07_009948 [Exophiala sideris]KAK5028030.1 hypothetical protein LTR13_009259 [Exophiala sideris]KAK5051771.1 hypothetical protein LTR69_010062 [Exophiala sideris]
MPNSISSSAGINVLEAEDISGRYWNANIPEERWTQECPEYLNGISEKNKAILSRKDDDFNRLTWTEVQHLVNTNHIERFQRTSSQLRAYLEYIHYLQKRYGSVLSYVQHERLNWEDITPSGNRLFTNPTDYKILYNDWPYYVDQDIKHLVIWTKFTIEEDEITGKLTPAAAAQVEEFISGTFCSGEGPRVERDQIAWFKNWKSLKSVHALVYIDEVTFGRLRNMSRAFPRHAL